MAFRRKVNKVDSKGKVIKGSLKKWLASHKGELYFDSVQEWQCWKYLKDEKIKFELQPEIELFPNKKVNTFKDGDIKTMVQRKMVYTPDFLLKIGKQKIYVEYKGYADPEFKMRWKLFKNTDHIGYIVYSVEDFIDLVDLLIERDAKGIIEQC